MKISIIIPVYNRSDKLIRLIKSIEKQTFSAHEVIVIDDGSTENIKAILDKFTNIKLKYIKIENSGGPAKPRNIGIKNATGDWIAFCDSDDWWGPKKLEEVNRIACNYDFIYHKLKIYYEKEKSEGNIIGTDFGLNPFSCLLKLRNPIPLSSVLVKRNIVVNEKFDESADLAAIEDYDLWLRIFRSGINCLFINDVLGYYSVDEDNISQVSEKSLYRLRALKEKFLMTENYQSNEKTFMQNYWYTVGMINLKLKQKNNAREAFHQAMKISMSICGLKALYRMMRSC